MKGESNVMIRRILCIVAGLFCSFLALMAFIDGIVEGEAWEFLGRLAIIVFCAALEQRENHFPNSICIFSGDRHFLCHAASLQPCGASNDAG